MMKWIDVNSGELPPVEQPILCYCPEWSETGYQVARWSEESLPHARGGVSGSGSYESADAAIEAASE